MKRLGVIDIGSYSTRLSIAEKKNNGFKILYEEGNITALGRGVKDKGILDPKAIEETLKVLKKYKEICEKFNVDKIIAVSTEALRRAKNKEEFLKKAKKLGIDIKILTPEEEGKLAYIGALSVIEPKGKICVIDQGGGSTEFIFGQGENIEEVHSLGIGIVNLTEKFLKNDPPTKEELTNLRNFLRESLQRFKNKNPDSLIGLGGTITTLASLEYGIFPYRGNLIDGKVLDYGQINHWFQKLAKMPLSERRKIPQIGDKRAEVILSGIAMFLEILKTFSKDKIIVSDKGLKHGIIALELKGKLLKEQKS
jgi:exopolyphosphatase/guanosine-5'-triphosphate,3'-diphosphate pyrophosphatase